MKTSLTPAEKARYALNLKRKMHKNRALALTDDVIRKAQEVNRRIVERQGGSAREDALSLSRDVADLLATVTAWAAEEETVVELQKAMIEDGQLAPVSPCCALDFYQGTRTCSGCRKNHGAIVELEKCPWCDSRECMCCQGCGSSPNESCESSCERQGL